jgi:selenocysteine lyase/cysteine desulfurase
MNIDLLAFPGHKSLLGPQGTGGLYIHPDLELTPLLHGGTGGNSEDIDQPHVRPERYEAGTMNTPGIAGLGAGVKYILDQTPKTIFAHEYALIQAMIEGLMGVSGVHILGPALGEPRTGLVSFTSSRRSAAEIAFTLDRHYHIATRAGLHCAPLAHEAADTLQTGAVRASVGYFTTRTEVDEFVYAIRAILE